ncbi:dioxygenase [Actinokineospora auranticolor]|uniref:Protocatechuate 3,4-dioxygenase beta subunit n=1 Tax=Actinokineospora auranticolor TaxID=155976 RepID=A0A2S6GM59_9PSEU|nr:dioxygenase [Actinokineospora auranticolor]PPK66329.1 protocatechuate 3,4-dioxygenase beta subunit [Actinokineospora auranticolor]
MTAELPPVEDELAGEGNITRKRLLQLGALVVPAAGVLGVTAAGGFTASAATPEVAPNVNGELLACTPGQQTTIAQTEGPYFKSGSPQRTSLVQPGTQGTRLTVSGFVFSRSCKPLANVKLDFWQADNGGNYDNVGYTFRGHQFTDASGKYTLTTIVPGLYPGRTRHIHVKVQNPGGRILTTQTYFPGEPRNNTDTIYDRRLLMNVRTVGSAKEATFDFVLNVA